jgi:hypothetical protein
MAEDILCRLPFTDQFSHLNRTTVINEQADGFTTIGWNIVPTDAASLAVAMLSYRINDLKARNL